MFAVVKYNDYRTDKCVQIIACLPEFDLAKKVAFNVMKKVIPERKEPNTCYKITTKIGAEYFKLDKELVSYRIVKFQKSGETLKQLYYYTAKCVVVEMLDPYPNPEEEEIDTSILCDKYDYEYGSDDEDNLR